MSLIDRFSSKSIYIGLAPRQLISVISQRKKAIVGTAASRSVDNPRNDWKPLLDEMRNFLQDANRSSTKTSSLGIFLSSHWCKTMMVPWTDSLLKKEVAEQFLISQYAAVYGEEAKNWIIISDDAPYGEPRLTCSIEKDLWQALQQTATENKKKCRLIEPVFSAGWRTISCLSGKAVKAFAIVEEGRLTLGRATQGKITAIFSQSATTEWPQDLIRGWQRWQLRTPYISETTEIHVLNLTETYSEFVLPSPFKQIAIPDAGLSTVYSYMVHGGAN